MNLKDRIQDAKLLFKNERRIWFILGFLGLCAAVFMMTNEPANKRPKAKKTAVTESKLDMNDAYKDLIQSLQQDVKDLRAQTAKQNQGFERIKTDLDNSKRDITGYFGELINKYDTLDKNVDALEEKIRNKTQQPSAFPEETQGDKSAGELEPVFLQENNVPEPPAPPKHSKLTFISPGDAVPVMLLSGVNAPVDGTPYPVVFKLNGSIDGPDGSALDLGEARLISAAQGSEVDGRVLFRLTNLSIRHKDGRRSVVAVDGWIVGEDGIRGMKGTLIDKLGETILAIAVAGTASAFAQKALGDADEGATVQNSPGIDITNIEAQDALGTGLNQATQRLVDVIIDRHEKLIPVVEVLSGREAVAVFSQPVEISPCENDCDGEDVFGSMD